MKKWTEFVTYGVTVDQDSDRERSGYDLGTWSDTYRQWTEKTKRDRSTGDSRHCMHWTILFCIHRLYPINLELYLSNNYFIWFSVAIGPIRYNLYTSYSWFIDFIYTTACLVDFSRKPWQYNAIGYSAECVVSEWGAEEVQSGAVISDHTPVWADCTNQYRLTAAQDPSWLWGRVGPTTNPPGASTVSVSPI